MLLKKAEFYCMASTFMGILLAWLLFFKIVRYFEQWANNFNFVSCVTLLIGVGFLIISEKAGDQNFF